MDIPGCPAVYPRSQSGICFVAESDAEIRRVEQEMSNHSSPSTGQMLSIADIDNLAVDVRTPGELTKEFISGHEGKGLQKLSVGFCGMQK